MDPLTPRERGEYEDDVISFSDRELDLLGDVRSLDVLYAGGTSPLWLEGLSQRVGREGSLTALDSDEERLTASRDMLGEADLAAPVRLVAGDVFEPPFEERTFDLVYSAGLFHELDVRGRPARRVLDALVSQLRPGGRLATSDFVDITAAVQLEDEGIQAEIARELSGACLFGIGSPERLLALHEAVLENVCWRLSPPHPLRHLDRLTLAGEEPAGLRRVTGDAGERLRGRWRALLEGVRDEGYTRPATIMIEGSKPAR